MLNLSTKLKLTRDTIKSPNLADKFSQDDLDAIGTHVWDGYARDKASRFKWENRTQSAMDLAMQLQKDKNFPWPGAANVAFPLVTIAALQFHSRAYPTLIQGTDIVKYRVIGEDPTGEEKKRADRIGGYMSYQLLEEDEPWEEGHDRLTINLPIVGSAFKKSYFDGGEGHNTSEFVMSNDLVMDYYAKSVEKCARKTHVFPLYRNEFHEGILTGIYLDYREEEWYQADARPLTQVETQRIDNRAGVIQPQSDETTPFTVLEQHLWLDLDGDGYSEPLIITIEANTRKVIRIVTRFDRESDIKRNAKDEIIKINAVEYFTRYEFIPSPDGGIYGLGFGILLGPLNESTNSLINQLIDAGTMSNSAGGFLGRGAKMRGGNITFAPLEWQRVDSTGDDLKKSIFPLPVREPSTVLFQLLSLLINYTNRISGTTDTMVGENPGQNTPAETTQTMVEQGTKIYTAVFKRIWRSMKGEFKKLYALNSMYLPEVTAFGAEGGKILREDFLGHSERVCPVADPNIVSEKQRMNQAQALKQAAMSTPGYNLKAVEHNYLRAMHIDGIEMFYPGPDKVPPLPNPKMSIEQMKLEGKKAQLDLDKQMFIADLMEQRRINTAKILELEAKAAKEVAEAGGIQSGQQIAAFNAHLGALKAHDDAMKGKIEILMNAMEMAHEHSQQQDANGRGLQQLAGAPGNQSPAQNPPGMA